MSLFDWFAENVYGVPAELARTEELNKKTAAEQQQYLPGGYRYAATAATQGQAAADRNASAVIAHQATQSAAAVSRTADEIYTETHPNSSATSGLAALFGNVLFLAVIGGAIYLFFTLGGAARVKKFSERKNGLWIVIGAALILVWFVWSRIKRTGESAANVGTQVSENLGTILG